MSDNHQYILRSAALSVPVPEADKLIAAGDGAAALLYLHMLRAGGKLDPEAAAKDLGFSQNDINRAVGALRGMGLLEHAPEKLRPADEMPEYTAEEVVVRTSGDRQFKAVLAETQRIFGRMLSGNELKTLFGIYDHLGMPAEVILLLINHCVEQYRERNGSGRLPTMRSIEKEAFVWANREIITFERAEEYLLRRAALKDSTGLARRMLGIADREPSATEKKYMENWLELGFSPEALEIAYDRTVTNTGKLAWKYMDSIIKSWHGKGLHTPQEIQSGDGRPAGSKKAATNASGAKQESVPQRDELERMRKIRDKIRNQ